MRRTFPLFATLMTLGVTTLPAMAATVTTASRLQLNTSLDSACTNSATHACDRIVGAALLASDQDGVGTSLDERREFFAVGSVSPLPNYVFASTVAARATLGSLHASVQQSISGPGGGTVPTGISAAAEVKVTDQIRLTSGSLANGTPVTLQALFDVAGDGRGALGLTIRGNRNGNSLGLVFGASDLASSFGDDLQDISGDFTAFIGETLQVEYELIARATSTTTAWNGLPRSSSSNYGNSAFLYFSIANPGLDAQVIGLGGFNYAAPSSVPLPPSGLVLLTSLGALLLRRWRVPQTGVASSVFTRALS